MEPLATNLFLTYAGRNYDRTTPLIDGRVKPVGVSLNYLIIEPDPDEIFRRMISYHEFHASELSLSSYITLRTQGDTSFVGIPVFPSRVFRHSFIFCNKRSGINEPRDLIGKKVGILEWQQTAVVWVKGMLQHEYDIPLEKIRWVRFRPERYKMKPPRKFTIEDTPESDPRTSVERFGRALEDGTIDALFAARVPKEFYQGDRIKRLFDDWVDVEKEYYRKTCIFPIMHVVVLRDDVYKPHPWVARSLIDAFTEAKKIAYHTMKEQSGDRTSYVWARKVLEEQLAVIGSDPYPYNVKDNRKLIETLMEYQIEQEIIDHKIPVEELFAPNTIDS